MLSLYQLMVTLGILLAFLNNSYFSYTNDWRSMLGIIFIPGIIMFISVLTLPRSPRWLMLKGKQGQGPTGVTMCA